jgi:hypothetical protein
VKDPIVEEVRRARKKIEAGHGKDWDALARYFIEKQKTSSRKVVAYAPKKLPDRGAA